MVIGSGKMVVLPAKNMIKQLRLWQENSCFLDAKMVFLSMTGDATKQI